MRFVAYILVFCFLAVCFSACGSDDTLVLNSKYFDELKAKEIDLQWVKNRYIDDPYRYNGPSFRLNLVDGKLCLEEQKEEFVHYDTLGYLSLVGIDRGEFGGGVMKVEYDSQCEIASTEVLAQDNCLGFLKPDEYRENENGEILLECYVFTGIAHMATDEGKIYKITTSGRDYNYTFEEFVDLGSVPRAFAEDDGNLIVATRKSLVSVDADGNITELFDAEYWDELYVNSMVIMDGCYYLGTSSGVLKFIPDTKETVWYPYYNRE